VGFFSVGLYPDSLAYNSAVHGAGERLLLACRPGLALFGAFASADRAGMAPQHVQRLKRMASRHGDYREGPKSLGDLIARGEMMMLVAISNHSEHDLKEAFELRRTLGSEQAVLALPLGLLQPRPAA
jgi:hypothetical protein